MYDAMIAGQRQISGEAAMAADQPGADGTSALGNDSSDGEKPMDSKEI